MSGNVTSEGILVAPGQVWRDLDKRMRGRTVKVVRVDAERGRAYYERPKNSIRIDRMRQPYWELVP